VVHLGVFAFVHVLGDGVEGRLDQVALFFSVEVVYRSLDFSLLFEIFKISYVLALFLLRGSDLKEILKISKRREKSKLL